MSESFSLIHLFLEYRVYPPIYVIEVNINLHIRHNYNAPYQITPVKARFPAFTGVI